jgi:hypothetical protein
MARGSNTNESFVGTAAAVLFGFFALVIATSATGRWLAQLGPEPVVVKKAAPPAAPAAPAPAAPIPAAPDTSVPAPKAPAAPTPPAQSP